MVFQPGQSGNPAGRSSTHQSFLERAHYLLNKHTIDEIRSSVKDDTVFGKMSVYDGMIMQRIAEAVTESGGKSMDSLLDRVLGKPSQFIKQEIDQTTTLTVEDRRRAADDEAESMLKIAAQKINPQPIH